MSNLNELLVIPENVVVAMYVGSKPNPPSQRNSTSNGALVISVESLVIETDLTQLLYSLSPVPRPTIN